MRSYHLGLRFVSLFLKLNKRCLMKVMEARVCRGDESHTKIYTGQRMDESFHEEATRYYLGAASVLLQCIVLHKVRQYYGSRIVDHM